MKLSICDLCYKLDKKLTQSTKYMRVKKHSELRIDYCANCEAKIPKDTTEYVKLAYKINGLKLTDEQAKNYFTN